LTFETTVGAIAEPVEFCRVDSNHVDAIVGHRYFDDAACHNARASYAKWLSSAIQRGVYRGWVALKAAEVVGGAGLVVLEWGPTRTDANACRGRLVNVFVCPQLRRRGLGRELVRRTLSIAGQIGLSTVGLSGNDASRTLYEGLGFRPAAAEMIRAAPAAE
jgi:GNAT superfamily N-acetyltransferase